MMMKNLQNSGLCRPGGPMREKSQKTRNNHLNLASELKKSHGT